MSGFGMFEANITSDAEEKRHVREAANQLAAATYDVRERFGKFLFASKDLTEYNDRLALSKNDILKTIEPHVFPRTGTVRRVLKPLEDEFKSRRGKTAMRRQAVDEDDYDGRSYRPTDPDLLGAGVDGFGYDNGQEAGTALGMEPATPAAAASSPSLIGPSGFGADLSDGFSGPPTPASSTAPAPQGSPNDPDAFKDGGPGNETPPIGDSIGAGNYDIQSGDTLTTISERAGLGADGVASLAEANGIDNPDLIYAGDSLTIPGGTDSAATDTSTATDPGLDTSAPTSAPSAPLPAEVGGSSPSITDPGLSSGEPMTYSGKSRRAASRRRYADFEGELKPKGDFKGYLSDVDEGDEGRTTNNFGGTFPGGTDHNGDPAKTDFVKDSTRRFALWCKANRRLANLDSLESYGPSDREYVAIAAMMQRVGADSTQPASPGSPMADPAYNTDPGPMYGGPISDGQGAINADTGMPTPAGPTVPNMTDVGMADAVGAGRITSGLARRYAKPVGPEWNSKGKPKINKPTKPGAMEMHESPEPDSGFSDSPSYGTPRAAGKHTSPWSDEADAVFQSHPMADEPELVPADPEFDGYERPMMKRKWAPGGKHRAEARRRTAAPDYLQKADEALTNLLNQKAEEFQGQIAPLQQALQTVQQAEQEAAAANPMNVMPPAGTVNVMPGGDPAQGGGDPMGGGGGGLDPNALAAMMGGGDPNAGGGDPMGGGDPSAMGGADPSMGAPPGLDPSAMGGAPPAAEDQGLPPMMAARRRFARLHQAKNCECWDGYCRVPGTKPCSEGSCEKCDTHRKEGRRRQAKNVEDMWQEYTQKATQRGGEPDVEAFAQQYRVGPVALKRIRQKISAGNRKRGGQGKGRRASAHTSTRRQAWSGWGGASLSMKRVAGWDFDHRLNGYITTAADTFSCDCGENFTTPSGYRKCGSCGRAWNSYVIGTDGHGKEASLEKVICREIPVRKDVIVASRRQAAPANFDQLHPMWEPGWGITPKYIQQSRQRYPHMADGTANQIAQFSSDVNLHSYDPVGHPVFGHDWSMDNPKAWNHFLKNEWGQPWEGPGGQGQFGGNMSEQYPGYDEFTGDPLPRGKRKADKHTLRRIDLRDMMDQEPEEDKPEIEHFAARRVAADGMSYEDTMAHIDKTLAEGERPRSMSQCIDCGGETLAPTSDWSQSRGIPFDGNSKWQFYYERGDSHPEEYGNVPDHWAPFGSWESSGFCKDCHPGNPKRQARRTAARLYVAQCRRARRRPTPEGLRRFMGSQQRNAKWPGWLPKPLGRHPDQDSVDWWTGLHPNDRDWVRKNYPDHPIVQIDRGVAREMGVEDRFYPPGDHTANRRQAEHFDITEEGGTPKGKGKPSKKTTMSTPDAQWYRRNRGGRYT